MYLRDLHKLTDDTTIGRIFEHIVSYRDTRAPESCNYTDKTDANLSPNYLPLFKIQIIKVSGFAKKMFKYKWKQSKNIIYWSSATR